MSFLSRAGVEMGHAVLDAYGNLVHGDDAGKAAKLVFLARPKLVVPSSPRSMKGKHNKQGKSSSAAEQNDGPSELSSNEQEYSLVTTNNPYTQTEHATTTTTSNSQHQFYDLGMTFVEINDRAYVKSVAAGSEAARAGIQPRDAVQFAFIHTDVKISSAYTSKDQDTKAAQYALAQERKGVRTSFAELSRMFPFDITQEHHDSRTAERQISDSSMASLEGEPHHGRGTLVNPQSAENAERRRSNISPGGGNNSPKRNQGKNKTNNEYNISSPLSSFIPSMSLSNDSLDDLDDTSNNSAGGEDQLSDMKSLVLAEQKQQKHQYELQKVHSYPDDIKALTEPNKTTAITANTIYPVAMVLRRTRQRQRLVGEGMPHSILPAFRLDDECDRASFLVGKLAPTPDMVPVPDAWDELCGHVDQAWLDPNGAFLAPLGCGDDGLNSVQPNNSFTADATFNFGPPMDATTQEKQQQQQQTPTCTTAMRTYSRRRNSDDEGSNGSESRHQYSSIPPDNWELLSSAKLEEVQQRLIDEAKFKEMEESEERKEAFTKIRACNSNNFPSFMDDLPPSLDDLRQVETTAMRGLIQTAVGLAFLRVSKVVLGVSVHAGSGIVVARLPDGTWSAPSAIGTWGFGLGLQFGLEVVDYLMIIQTQEALEQFKEGSHVIVGGNVGVAVAGAGRGAFGAASIRNSYICGGDRSRRQSSSERLSSLAITEEASVGSNGNKRKGNKGAGSRSGDASKSATSMIVNDTELAPIMAYAKTQGFYVGVSLDGLKIFTRDDINAKEYKLAMNSASSKRDITPRDILSGKVATPPEAEALYGILHSVEYAHVLSTLPRPPPLLRQDNEHDWRFDKPCAILLQPHRKHHHGAGGAGGVSAVPSWSSNTSKTSYQRNNSTGNFDQTQRLFDFFECMSEEELESLNEFETKFKQFLYGGVSVQRLLPNAEVTASGKTRRERRTLWLMLPEVGSLRLGFLSKVSDRNGNKSNNITTPSSNNHGSSGSNSSINANNARGGERSPSETIASSTTSQFNSFFNSGDKHRRQSSSATSFPFQDDFNNTQGEEDSGTLFSEELFSLDDTATYTSITTNRDKKPSQWSTSPRRSRTVQKGDTIHEDPDWIKKDDEANSDPPRKETNANSTNAGGRDGVQLSQKHSMALTDVTRLSQDPSVSIRFSPDDATEHLRLISIQSNNGTSLLFLANTFREAELLVCGLKLLLERETNRLLVRGGQTKEFLEQPTLPRSRRVSPTKQSQQQKPSLTIRMPEPVVDTVLFTSNMSDPLSPLSVSSTVASSVFLNAIEERNEANDDFESSSSPQQSSQLPDGQTTWSQVRQRQYLQQQATAVGTSGGDGAEVSFGTAVTANDESATNIADETKKPSSTFLSVGNSDRPSVTSGVIPPPLNPQQQPVPTYAFGELIHRDIVVGVQLPLPLVVCRALLLDSTSPLIMRWHQDRGDSRYVKSPWMFSPEDSLGRTSPHEGSEPELIARGGCMRGAYRTLSFNRSRNGSIVNLMETQMVEIDDDLSSAPKDGVVDGKSSTGNACHRVELVVTERTPRRGFSVRIRIRLEAPIVGTVSTTTLSVFAECRPMGRNMSNQSAVHKAYCLVINEIAMRYGIHEPKGLVTAFRKVIESSSHNLSSTAMSRDAATTTGVQHQQQQPHLLPSPMQHSNNRQDSWNNMSQPPERRQQLGTQSLARGVGSVDNSPMTGGPSNSNNGRRSPPGEAFFPPQPLVRTQNVQSRGSPGLPVPPEGGGRKSPSSPVTFADVLNANRPTTRIVSAKEEMRDQRERERSRKHHEHQQMLQQHGSHSSSSDEDDLEMEVSDSDEEDDEGEDDEPMTIEVKPLPKIRLSLMPAPREEDEYEEDEDSEEEADAKGRGSKSKGGAGGKSSSRKSKNGEHPRSSSSKRGKNGTGSNNNNSKRRSSKKPSSSSSSSKRNGPIKENEIQESETKPDSPDNNLSLATESIQMPAPAFSGNPAS